MKKTLGLFLLMLLSTAAIAGETATDPMARPPIARFLSEGFGTLNEQAPAETKQFGQLVGLWRVETEMAANDGSFVATAPGFWAWKYVLDGYAVSDLWYQGADNLPSYMANLGHDYLLTANRIYAVADKQWHVTWMANGAGKAMGQDVGSFTATMEGDELVMRSAPNAFGLQRVVFSDFTDNGFRWSSDYSRDEGKTWMTVMRMKATRISK